MRMVLKSNLRRPILILALLLSLGTVCQAAETIKIGLNLSYSGPRKSSGLASKIGAEMVKDQINSAGGLLIGGKNIQLSLSMLTISHLPNRLWPMDLN